MKKNLFLFLLYLVSLPAFCQTFYQSVKDKGYKNLMKNGLTYVLTGDEKIDGIMEEALKDEWKVCPYRIANQGETLKEDDVQIKFLTDGYSSKTNQLTIVSEKELRGSRVNLYHTIATADIEWFGQAKTDIGPKYFIPYLISAYNDMATKMNDNQIDKTWTSYFNKMHELYLPSAKVLKGKTLLITCHPNYINEAELKKAGIQYEFVSFDRFLELESKEPANYCLLYFRPEMRASDVTIYNLQDKSIVYARHSVKYIAKLDKEDINYITSSWK